MTNPITPPLELVQQWLEEADSWRYLVKEVHQYIATRAAQWGADQELEACCEWLDWQKLAKHENLIAYLRAARRPKSPSLKEQALNAHNRMMAGEETQDDWAIVRRALEALPDG